MNHIIKRKLDEKELALAVARGEAIIKMEEIIGTLNESIEKSIFNQELMFFHFGDLSAKFENINMLQAQKNTLEALTIYED